MRLSKSWIIAAKDFRTFRKKGNIMYSIIAVPLIVAVLLPGVIDYATNRTGGKAMSPAELVVLLPAFIFFYVILAAYVPTPIASYTLVGEKVEKSLEPLLATPTTDAEILLGKALAAFLPSVVAVIGGATVFMILMDTVAYNTLHYYYFPDWNTGLVLLVIVPLVTFASIQVNVIVSSRVTDVRSGQQIGIITVLPFAGIYLAGELNILNLSDTNNLLIVAGILLVACVVLFYASRATFRRDEILTKWR